MQRFVKKYLPFVFCLLYGVCLTFIGIVMTGMGHGENGKTLPFALGVSPLGGGFLLWATIGFLLSRTASKRNGIYVLCLLAVYYLGVLHLLHSNGFTTSADVRREIASYDASGIWQYCAFYLTGQVYVWVHTLRGFLYFK